MCHCLTATRNSGHVFSVFINNLSQVRCDERRKITLNFIDIFILFFVGFFLNQGRRRPNDYLTHKDYR